MHIPGAKQLLEKCKAEVVKAYRDAIMTVQKNYVAEVKLIMDELFKINQNVQNISSTHVSDCHRGILPGAVGFKSLLNSFYNEVGL